MVNLSKYKTSDVQNKLLARGLNYAVSPESIVDDPSITNEYIVACEKVCWKLPKGEAAQLRAEVVGSIKSTKPPKPNVTAEERKAIKKLQKETSIIILPADKGRATVIMDIDEYDAKLTEMLSDTNTYTKLKKEPHHHV